MSHLLLYSFPGAGHIIPLLDLIHLLLRRGLIITVMITAADISLLNPLLSSHPSSLHKLVYNEPEITPSPHHPLIAKLPQVVRDYKTGDQDLESFRKGMLANLTSWGIVYNTFEKLEGVYIDYIKKYMGHPRVWAVGPLLPEKDGPVAVTGRGGSSVVPPGHLLRWLDQKPDESVVYICFGSQESGSTSGSSSIPGGFEDRVGNRGFVVKGWVPQLAILRHRAVGSFVTHCGWNSTLEGITAGVMMFTWPMIADQFANAALLVDQLGVGKRVCEGGPERVPDSVELARLLDESLNGDRPERVKIKELNQAAAKAVEQGTSTRDLDAVIKLLSEI
ncbi:hypothetical protein L1987_08470 [Smallanthus sonchifolius]|uniref:Uncharacterized protein n=1 Tax=Smallanthus sonchifolius TaxID=185202 RepID=A0ACB9JMG6_9ASTR|nr:hypothetical protein L1987_08470 [Smallanthus sonchifolius]